MWIKIHAIAFLMLLVGILGAYEGKVKTKSKVPGPSVIELEINSTSFGDFVFQGFQTGSAVLSAKREISNREVERMRAVAGVTLVKRMRPRSVLVQYSDIWNFAEITAAFKSALMMQVAAK